MNRKRNIWTPAEVDLLERLNSPRKIQDYLDGLSYDVRDGARSARVVMREQKTHCFGGALLACAALRYHGKPPLIIDLESSRGEDEDHVVTIYKHNDYWGAISKSKFEVLRFRDPVYQSLRELVMTYFEFYFNSKGKKTLRKYSTPIDLTRFDDEWMISEKEDITELTQALIDARHYDILTPQNKKAINKVDNAMLNLGFSNIDADQYSF